MAKRQNDTNIFTSIVERIRQFFAVIRSFFIQMKVRPRRRKRREKVNAWTLFWFPFLVMYLEFMLRLLTKTPVFPNWFYPAAFGFAFGLLISAFVHLFPPKAVRVISIIGTIVLCFFYGMMIIIYNSYGAFMTINTIKANAGNVAGGFFKMMMLAILSNWYVVILCLLPVAFYCIFGKKTFRPHRYRWPMAVVMVVVSLLLFAVTSIFAATGKTAARYDKQYNFSSAVQTFGLTCGIRLNGAYASRTAGFTVIDHPTEDTAETETDENGQPVETTAAAQTPKTYGKNIMDIDFAGLAASTSNQDWKSLDEYVQTVPASNQNEYTGLFKGKNLILITAEAFYDGFVDPNLTPALYRLLHNGFYFSDYYQPAWGGSTITGELSNVLGLAPTNSVDTIYETIGHNNYFTMGNQLQRLGYYNIAYHDGDYNYYDRDTTHENLGYGEWMGIGNGLEDITNGWPGDELTFDATMDTYLDLQPFSIYYMTVSGHCTYDGDDYKVDLYYDLVNSYYPDLMETTKYFICYQMQLEDAFKVMLDKLEKAGIADDTVIVMTTDHYPYGLAYGAFGNTEDYLSDLYGHATDEDWDRDESGLIIWCGSLEHENKNLAKEISTPVTSLDILPTLSNLFGLEYDSRLLVGRDVFSNTEPLVFWLDYTWKTDKGLYDSYYEEFYPADDVEMSEEEQETYVDRITQTVINKINYSRAAVSSDYFYHLFGEDTDTSTNEDAVRAANAAKPAQPPSEDTAETSDAEEDD